MRPVTCRSASILVVAGMALAPAAHALTFQLDYGDGITGTLNTVFTGGTAIRMENRSNQLLGKANINPNVCGGVEQGCQGVFKDEIHPAQALARSPGQAYLNADDGNWNYDRYDLTQAPFKMVQDLSLSMGNYGFFAKWYYFYDFVNNDFMEYHPNLITEENRDRVGCGGSGGNCVNVSSFDQAYGPGEPTHLKRTNGEVLRQVGTDLQLFDYYFYGSFNLPFSEDHAVTFKLGNQTVNWGESTVLVINSINQVNAVNANNLTRVGFDLSELFVPTGMLVLSTELWEGATVEAFYGYDWAPVEIPAPGSFFSFTDIGTNNAIMNASISFGGPAEDPDTCGTTTNPDSGCGVPLNSPLAGLTSTSTTIRRLRDNEPSDQGQFGVSLKYFAETLNNGTELGFYFMNYHSKLPYVSFYSTDMSCARLGADHSQDGGADMDVTSVLELLLACPGLPLLSGTTAEDARNATSNAVPIDAVKFRLEYPENLQMYGFSFNTTVGDWSVQGEMSYRPDSPLQIDNQDLTFHALGPMLTRCHDPNVGCTGSTGGTAADNTVYTSSDFTAYPESPFAGNEYPDTFDLLVGAGVGSARSFPSFIGAWRGVPAGETPPNSYIRGWEYFDVYQFILGSTYVQGATEWFPNALGADQMIWFFEAGAQWVPDLPGTELLQIEAPGTWYHASAGADGSMTGDLRQDCSHTPDCNFGPDGLRFNPHQENHDNYADPFSWGYAIVNLTRYESVFPGISFQPLTIFQHDVKGTSTDVAAQFSEDAMQAVMVFEIRYKEALSVNPGYVWNWGGGATNLLRDRDQAMMYVKYQF